MKRDRNVGTPFVPSEMVFVASVTPEHLLESRVWPSRVGNTSIKDCADGDQNRDLYFLIQAVINFAVDDELQWRTPPEPIAKALSAMSLMRREFFCATRVGIPDGFRYLCIIIQERRCNMTENTNFDGAKTSLDQGPLREDAVERLLVQVGERVRKAREQRGIPRRVLSEMSGVSQRYLAQLEAGAGNISIGLLKRVALALDQKIEWFFGEEDPWSSDVLRVAELYRSADAATKDAVMNAFSLSSGNQLRKERICLIGLRGAGKSTLGRLAAENLAVPFLELNKEIELYGGMPLGEIIALYGQEGYRALENESLDKVVAKHDRVIMAVAGGIVTDPNTYNKLQTYFHTIWVKASAQEHMERVRAQGDLRPMEGYPEAMVQLKSLLKNRESLYARAPYQLDTMGHSIDESLAQLLTVISSNDLL